MNKVMSLLILTVALAGCGGDLLGTAVTEAELGAQQAKQAQQMKDQVESRLDAAMQSEHDRLQQAEMESNP